MTFDQIVARAAQDQLAIFGGLQGDDAKGAPSECETLLLLGPREPGFWPYVTAAPEFQDGEPDPLDRWSERVIGTLATELGAEPVFPFGGPPYAPFFSWATGSGSAWASPVMLLVQAEAGLMVSYRGALAFRERLVLHKLPASPCLNCAAPCATACPAGALSPEGYDVPVCHAYLDTAEGQDCLTRGCAVRRACPVSQSYGRLEAQSAYHMSLFHPGTHAP